MANAVLVEGLKKRFGSVEALAGIDFEVPAGTIFGLLGPNGAGKTTVVRILSTIIRPDAGHAEVLGRDVVHDAAQVRYLIGLAGQNAAIDPNLTGRENLRLIGRLAQMPRNKVKPRANELLERFNLVQAADRPIKTYSGGMRRRLDVAAALVAKPRVLFLDEPTTGLDIQSRTELWEVIRELVAEGATVLLTTQYLEEADVLADRIAVVNEGRVVANDTAAALKARLGNTVIELEMGEEEAGKSAEALLTGYVADHVERDGAKVHLTTNQAPTVLMEMLRSLDAYNLVPAGISVREPSLDDVFLSLTGRHPGTEASAESPGEADREAVTGAGPRELRSPAGRKAFAGTSTRRPRGPRSVSAQAVAGAAASQSAVSQPPPAEPEPSAVPATAAGADSQGVDRVQPGGPAAQPDGDASPDSGKSLELILAKLPFKAGSGTVAENLEEVAEAAVHYYQNGGSRGGRSLNLAPLTGYLVLEQRFGRISDRTSPDHAASLLVGAAASQPLVFSSWPDSSLSHTNGDAREFARGAVQILLDGIAQEGSRV